MSLVWHYEAPSDSLCGTCLVWHYEAPLAKLRCFLAKRPFYWGCSPPHNAFCPPPQHVGTVLSSMRRPAAHPPAHSPSSGCGTSAEISSLLLAPPLPLKRLRCLRRAITAPLRLLSAQPSSTPLSFDTPLMPAPQLLLGCCAARG